MSLNSPDSYLDIHDANLRIGGDVEAQAIKLAQIEIISNATTTSTVQFNNATKSFDAASNIEVGTANLFVDTTTSKVGIGTNAPAYTLDVRGNVYALSDVDIGIGYRDNLIPKMTGRVNNVNITALNQRTRTSYATAEKAASTWTPRTIDASAWLSVAWSPELSLFVAVAFSGTNQLATSPDGITWTGRTMVTGGWTGIVWSSELSLFVAVAYSGTNQLATSPDGITWTGRTMVTGGWNRITWSPELSLFVAVEYQGNQFATSTDGINWTSGTITTGALGEWADIVWSPELSIFVTVDYSSNPGRFATSTDGTNWTTHTIGGTNWISVAWSPELSLFVAVSGNNTNNFATSPDGINWTIGTIVSGIWTDLIWSPESSLFVAVGFSSGTNHIATSPDGITWTSHTIASGDWKRILWSPELSLFVTLGTGGTNQAATSNFVIPSPLNTPMSHPGQLHVDTTTGNVGIGTINPDATLHVTGNAYVSSNLEVGTANLFVDTTNSRVGIGVASPDSTLQVSDTLTNYKIKAIPLNGVPEGGAYYGYILLAKAATGGIDSESYVVGKILARRGTSGTGHKLNYYDVVSSRGYNNNEILSVNRVGNRTGNDGFTSTVKVTYGGVVYHALRTGSTGGQPTTDLTFWGASKDAALIMVDSSMVSNETSYGHITSSAVNGNVGVGTANPQQNLHIHEAGSGQVVIAVTNDTTGSGNNDGIHFGIDSSENGFVWHKPNKPLKFATENTERMRIDSGTTVAVAGGTAGKGVSFAHAGIAIDRVWNNYPSITVMNQNSTGDTNQSQLRIHGCNVSYSSYPSTSGSDFGCSIYIDGTYQTNSDRRFKTNITTIDNALDKVMSLSGKRYQLLNADGSIRTNVSTNDYKYGFIAQDLEALGLDETFIHYTEEDDGTEGYNKAYSVDYDSFIPLLVNAIKEQNAIIDTTRNQLETERNRNDELEARILALENSLS